MSRMVPREMSRAELVSEAASNGKNACVGRELVLENARVRIWKTILTPGERMAYHVHRLDFLWTALSDCPLIFHDAGGAAETMEFDPGEVAYHRVPRNSEVLRTICNIGPGPAAFTVVEFLNSDNVPLPIPEHIRKWM